MLESIREWFDRTRHRVFRRRSLGGWIVTIIVALWAVADKASTAQSIARWWSAAQPYLSHGWTAVASIDRFWYQMALLFIGLGWVAYVASRPEPIAAAPVRRENPWISRAEGIRQNRHLEELEESLSDDPSSDKPSHPREQGNALLRTGNELLGQLRDTESYAIDKSFGSSILQGAWRQLRTKEFAKMRARVDIWREECFKYLSTYSPGHATGFLPKSSAIPERPESPGDLETFVRERMAELHQAVQSLR